MTKKKITKNDLERIKKIYDNFHSQIRKIEAKRDASILAILKNIDNRQISKINKELK